MTEKRERERRTEAELLTSVVVSGPDVVVAQPVVLQEGLHGVGRSADVAGVHRLRVVQLLLSAARLVAVGCVSPLHCSSPDDSALQKKVLQIRRLHGGHRCSFSSACTDPSRSSFGGLSQPVGRPVLTPAAPRPASVPLEDAVLLSQVPLQQGAGVEGFAAEATRELLAVRGDVTLELHFCSKRLATENALSGFES